MLAEIVLSAGTDRIAVREIPALFADAIHPPLSKVALRIVTDLKTFPLSDENKRLWCGAGIGMAFPVSLTAADMEALAALFGPCLVSKKRWEYQHEKSPRTDQDARGFPESRTTTRFYQASPFYRN